MKKRHVLLSLLLVAALLISLLAACANNETPSTDTPNTNNNTPSSNTDKQPDQTPDADTDSDVPAQDFDPENPDEILFYFYDLYSHGAYGDKIIDAVNEITIPLIGVKVDIEWYDMGSYVTKLGLSIADGTPVDLVNIMPAAPTSVANLHANNQLMDISELLPEYAPGAYELIKDYLGAFTYTDGIFGFPSLKNFSNNYYVMMREDILKELDLYDFASNMTTWSEYEQIMQAVTDAYQGEGMYALGRARGNSVTNGVMQQGYEKFFDYSPFDTVGDTLAILSTDKEGHVYSFYEVPETVAGMKRLASWMEKGYIWPDSAFSDTDGDVLISGGTTFSKMEGGEIGVEVRQKANCGTDMLCVKVMNGFITTSSLTSWGLAVPITADEPEAAMRFVNQLYTNADLMNVLLLGIEGEDYVMLDTGEAAYPAGKEDGSVEYHEADWLFGNQFLVHPWTGNGADYREIAAQENVNSEISTYLGFTLDVSELNTLIASLSAVKDQYVPSFSCGLYTDAEYQDFLDKLYSVGMQDYIDEVQTQLDAWLASQ